MLMAPIFAIIFAGGDMVATVTAMELAVSLHLFPQSRRDCRWDVVGPMGIAACLFMPLGLWLLASVDQVVLTRTIAAIVVAFSLLMLAGWRTDLRYRPAISAGIGAVSGAMVATTSIAAPPVLLYLLSGRDAPAVIRANIIAYYFVILCVLLALLLLTGLASWIALARAALLCPVMLIGSWIGARLFRGADERTYRTVALLVLLAVGLYALWH